MQAGDGSDRQRVIVFSFYRAGSLAELEVVIKEALDVEAKSEDAGCILEHRPKSITNQRSEGLQQGVRLRPAAPRKFFNPGFEQVVFGMLCGEA